MSEEEKEVVNRSRKGDYAEYYAVTWLWDQGYEVYCNAGCTGPVDMVAMSPEGDTILIDVKTLQQHRDANRSDWNVFAGLTDLQKQLGVQVLTFHPVTRELNFVKHRTHETTYSRYRDKQQSQLDLDSSDAGC